MSQTESIKPWYRQNWLWFLMSIPISSVILSSIMVYVAVDGRDSLVSDNYYKDGMKINQTLEQDRLAASLGLQPALSISDDGLASVVFTSNQLPRQAFVELNILHPTLAERDVSVKLLPVQQANAEQGFIGNVPAGLSGRYYIDLYAYDRAWRIREEVFLPLTSHRLNTSGNRLPTSALAE